MTEKLPITKDIIDRIKDEVCIGTYVLVEHEVSKLENDLINANKRINKLEFDLEFAKERAETYKMRARECTAREKASMRKIVALNEQIERMACCTNCGNKNIRTGCTLSHAKHHECKQHNHKHWKDEKNA